MTRGPQEILDKFHLLKLGCPPAPMIVWKEKKRFWIGPNTENPLASAESRLELGWILFRLGYTVQKIEDGKQLSLLTNPAEEI
jgi:hypothetical protein